MLTSKSSPTIIHSAAPRGNVCSPQSPFLHTKHHHHNPHMPQCTKESTSDAFTLEKNTAFRANTGAPSNSNQVLPLQIPITTSDLFNYIQAEQDAMELCSPATMGHCQCHHCSAHSTDLFQALLLPPRLSSPHDMFSGAAHCCPSLSELCM